MGTAQQAYKLLRAWHFKEQWHTSWVLRGNETMDLFERVAYSDNALIQNS